MLNQKGFTLVELLAVMIIMGVMLVIAIPKFINMDNRAEVIAFDFGVEELNGREKQLWVQSKLGSVSYSTDQEKDDAVWIQMLNNLDIGFKYELSSISQSGATMTYGGQVVKLERVPATRVHPAIWGGTDSNGKKYGWHKNPNNPHYTAD